MAGASELMVERAGGAGRGPGGIDVLGQRPLHLVGRAPPGQLIGFETRFARGRGDQFRFVEQAAAHGPDPEPSQQRLRRIRSIEARGDHGPAGGFR
jgi:hypothetical protein